MHSAVYVGTVSHARRGPRPHGFRYAVRYLYLDLDELPALERGAWFGVERPALLSFRRRDYRAPLELPLKEVVLDDVERELGQRPDGPVRLLTQVRIFGYVFNPVSFYYCFDRGGQSLRAVVAEITNTPWRERHAYVVAAPSGETGRTFDKAFHVSPFFPMSQRYTWALSEPGRELNVSMSNWEADQRVFSARLELTRRPWSSAELRRVAFAHSAFGLATHARIYVQACRLWLKRTPFFSHPAKVPPNALGTGGASVSRGT